MDQVYPLVLKPSSEALILTFYNFCLIGAFKTFKMHHRYN